ncbi:DeoR/GlpR family DNA-binding transcription regulator [Dactylosporangium sp. NPDC048998]|uniref:DeoR/GlpR family DNA-binding transcription regulator n=1 Tax=Dactylosporangium sp. NPDC048998 TaxID=3363976 RepID=UPI0037114910
MIIEVRRAEILAAARQRGGVGLQELSRRFHVSIPTIRRDLSALAERGLLRRVHGGAVPLAAVPPVLPDASAASGGDVQAAAALVEPGMAIGVSGRRLGVRLAALVGDVPGLTLVTPMLAVARAVRNASATVLLVGGVRTPSGSHAGPLAEQTLQGLHLDIAFVEPCAPGDALAAATDQAMLRRASRRVHL